MPLNESTGTVIDALKMKLASEVPEVGQVDTEPNVVRPENLRRALDSAELADAVAAKRTASVEAVSEAPDTELREARQSRRENKNFESPERVFGGSDIAAGLSRMFKGQGNADKDSNVPK